MFSSGLSEVKLRIVLLLIPRYTHRPAGAPRHFRLHYDFVDILGASHLESPLLGGRFLILRSRPCVPRRETSHRPRSC